MHCAAAFAAALLASGPAGLGSVPDGALRVYVVRHGQAFTNLTPPPEMTPEQLDRLTELGQAQSRATADALRGRGVSLIVTSPRGRTQDTATVLRAVLEVPVRVDERLRGLEMGKSAGGRELEWSDRMKDWSAGRDPVPSAGESLEQLGQRVLQLASELKRELGGKSVVFVTHGELIGNLIGMLQGQALEARFEARIANASITALEAPAAALPRVLFVNFLPEEKKAAEAPRARATRPAARRLAAP
jgi:ribonuclease H / adenosylcobalamin/alpha-ribazole phosphatase